MKFEFEPIGFVQSCFSEKFGIPRQPGLAPNAVGRIELSKKFSRTEMVKELDRFSHIWVHFVFHEAVEEGWRPTVRPPWLGGQKRVGVFASRSPHRPNFLGLSVVRLKGVTHENGKVFLEIAGIDMLDKTPVVDIRPYLPYSDVVQQADGGYTTSRETVEISVQFSDQADAFCSLYQSESGRRLKELIKDVLEQDPRPASQRKQDKEYGVLLWNVNVRFTFEQNDLVVVRSCELE